MKRMTLIFTNGNKATYDNSEIKDLEGVYDTFKEVVGAGEHNGFIIRTDNRKHETAIMLNNLVAIDVEY